MRSLPPLLLRAVLSLGLVLTALLAPASAAALKDEPSAFLRSFAESPVNWMTWGDEAFARARQEDKPVYLAIGIFTSELSRAMLRQTFSNAETAAMLNEEFVCILVDANERPDLAALYQNYIQSVKQLTGMPLNLWLTPELKPFDGANYLPPTEEWGKEGFLTVARRAAAGWKADPAAQRAKADEAVATVLSAQPTEKPAVPTAEKVSQVLTEATEAWQARFDPANGGFGEAPKYLEPELLRFLLRNPDTRDLALTTLRALLRSPIRDPLDGGFFRYVNDAEWRLPYFQKTLVDQARIALALLEAAKLSGEAAFAEAARGALNYALDQLGGSDGELAAAEDATPENIMASYFWTVAEIEQALGREDAALFNRVYGVTPEGNVAPDAFANLNGAKTNLLYLAAPEPDLAAIERLAKARATLLERRRERAKPLLDHAATSGAHGLLLAALSQAGAQLSDARFSTAATLQFAFMRDRLLTPEGGLRRLATRPFAAAPADYAMAIEGLLAYQHSAPQESAAGTLAEKLLVATNTRYLGDAGRYLTSSAQPEPGFWARVGSPVPAPGEPPVAEAAMLIALAPHALADDTRGSLSGAIVADIQASAEAPRGDLLLALKAIQPK